MKLKEISLEEALAITCHVADPGEEKQRVYRLVPMTGCETGYDYNRTTVYFLDEESGKGEKND